MPSAVAGGAFAATKQSNMSIKEQIAALWDALPPKWKYIAIDGDGSICAYTHPPERLSSAWIVTEGEYIKLEAVCDDQYYTRPEPTNELYTPGVAEFPELFTNALQKAHVTGADQLRAAISFLRELIDTGILSLELRLDCEAKIRAIERASFAGEYTAAERDCRSGCMGPCGRCEEDAPAYTADQLREMAKEIERQSKTEGYESYNKLCEMGEVANALQIVAKHIKQQQQQQ